MAANLRFGTREEIVADLATAIAAIAGMKRVDRHHLENLSNYEYPSAFINEVRETRKRYCSDVVKVDGIFSIVLFNTTEGVEETASTILNALVAAGVAAIMADESRGEHAYSTEISSIDTDQGFAFPHVVVIFTIVVQYLAVK